MQFCDIMCKYAEWSKKLMDGSSTCRTFVAIFCTKKGHAVYKNAPCIEKELRKNRNIGKEKLKE